MHSEALSNQLLEWQCTGGRTVIHGDFKTANLFFRQVLESSEESSQVVRLLPGPSTVRVGWMCAAPSDGYFWLMLRRPEMLQVCACDFQWTGWGLPMQDVVYLLWTSVEPDVLQQHEGKLLHYYMLELHAQLRSHGVHMSDEDLNSAAEAASGRVPGDLAHTGVQSLSPSALRRQYEVPF